MVEAGRMASRLIHDFKNQLGGLKLYASYLKKRFADNPEAVEITEKIIQGLNEMADQAALVAKLTRPIKLRRESCDLTQFVEMVINSLKSQIEAKRLRVVPGLVSAGTHISIDIQQMQIALSAILARAIDASPEDLEVNVGLKSTDGAIEIEISDQGEAPSEQKLQSFFDPLTNERINPISLGLALGRRIIELHGGEVSAQAASPVGTLVKVKLVI